MKVYIWGKIKKIIKKSYFNKMNNNIINNNILISQIFKIFILVKIMNYKINRVIKNK